MFRRILNWKEKRKKIRQIMDYKLIQESEQIEKEKALEEKLKEELIEKAMKIEFFPGSLQEYEKLKNEEYEIVDTTEREKGVIYHPEHRDKLSKLVELNVEAIIRCRKIWKTKWGSMGDPEFVGIYGVPVKKKK